MQSSTTFKLAGIILLAVIFSSAGFAGEACILPDNGSGTATLPPLGCEYSTPNEPFMIINGLPGGTTIEMYGVLNNFVCCDGPSSCSLCSLSLSAGECETAGGTLSGDGHCFAATLDLDVVGTGDLYGFNRHLAVSVFGEMHTAPRNAGQAVQTFANRIYRLSGILYGDPDFCAFQIRGGSSFGYGTENNGVTTLTELPSGDFAVDSFFDITYQIEFEGCPGSVLADMNGITTETTRMVTGFAECKPTTDGNSCETVACLGTSEECQPKCMEFDLDTEDVTVVECECREPNSYHVESPVAGPSKFCYIPDNGSGTATLPPIGCEYNTPNEPFMIIDGLPGGTTIEMDGTLKDFVCCDGPTGCSSCSLSLSAGQCETSGGTLGGDGDCFASTLELNITGTGDLAGFDRHLAVPVFGEMHTAPRNPGDAVQTFANRIYTLSGELFGDPDFCTFRIRGGSSFGYGSENDGETILTKLASGDFAVDSFFDITYQIEFEGCPGSVLEDMNGITTETTLMVTGGPMPYCAGDCPAGMVCNEVMTANCADGSIDVCCEMKVPNADLNRDGNIDFRDLAIFAAQWLTPGP